MNTNFMKIAPTHVRYPIFKMSDAKNPRNIPFISRVRHLLGQFSKKIDAIRSFLTLKRLSKKRACATQKLMYHLFAKIFSQKNCMTFTLYLQRKILCASAVPAAAPAAPNPALKMKKGSRAAFSAVKASAQARGVAVSPRPRKIPFTTSQSVAAGAPSAQTRKYASAGARIADAGPTCIAERIGPASKK